MDIYESLNHITKLAFPRIKYTWENWSINDEKPIFQISILSNKIEDYIEDHYEKGLKAILKVIEEATLSSEVEHYAKQLLVVLADHAINYHSDICKNKPEIACKLYKKNVIFREAVIEYAPYLYRLLPNLIANSFFNLDYNTIKDVCNNCVTKIYDNKKHSQKIFWNFIKNLRDEFTYNHSFSNLITNDNVLNYWEMANYINEVIPELNFFEVNDGIIIATVKKELDEIEALAPLEKLFDSGIFWTALEELPEILEFKYIYPNGSNGDILKYILEEYGETHQIEPNLWKGKLSRQYIDLLEMLGPTAKKISMDEAFLEIYEHHIPSILYNTRMHLFSSKVSVRANFEEIAKKVHTHKLGQRKQRDKVYADLIMANKTSPKWKSEAQLFSLVSSQYPDAVYQYRADWLGMQSLDIFIPSLCVGIEYQGRQHYEPIEHFGGEKHFKHQQENDKKKKSLCTDNGIVLVEWSYTREITEANLRKYLEPIVGE